MRDHINHIFEYYGERAGLFVDPTEMAVHYPCQREAERNIVLEIARILDLKPTDRVLDIRCNAGTSLIPMSFLVESITGIDHPKMLDRCDVRNARLIGEDFLTMDLEKLSSFSKIFIYNSIHCSSASKAQVFQFLDRAASLLEVGGQMLIGNTPNTDKEQRFLDSEKGRNCDEIFNRIRRSRPDTLIQKEFAGAIFREFNDEFLLKIMARYRSKGFDAYLLPQSPNLPFGFTREDLLVTRIADAYYY